MYKCRTFQYQKYLNNHIDKLAVTAIGVLRKILFQGWYQF